METAETAASTCTFRSRWRPTGIRPRRSWTRGSAAAGAELLSIESVGGKEVSDDALQLCDLPQVIFALCVLGVRDMRIITNNPGKRAGIDGYGLTIIDRVPLEIEPNEKNLEYLRTKKEKLGHVLNLMG